MGKLKAFPLKSEKNKQNKTIFPSLTQCYDQKSIIAVTQENKIRINKEEFLILIPIVIPIAGDKI